MDKGGKFVPCYFENQISFLLYSKYFILEFLKDFNKRILFLNNKYKNKNIVDIIAQFEKETTNNNSQHIPITTEINSDIDQILKKLAVSKKIKDSFPLQMETVDLEFLLYKEFNEIKFDTKNNNISKEEFKAIKYFIKNKPFKVTDCDKKVGIAVISTENYNNLSFFHLNNTENFLQLTEDNLENTQDIIIDKLIDLKNNFNISKRLYNNLFLTQYKQGTFRILPKLHKNKFSTRPIINCIKHPTSNLSLFIDAILQPWVQNSDTFIKDSQHLIQQLEKLKVDNDSKLCSFDFESLYSNIDLEHALFVITDFMTNKINSEHFNLIGFHHILKLVFNNNIFIFNPNNKTNNKNSLKYFKQIKGVAMGSKCGPTIANIYLNCLEKKFLSLYKIPFYGRYIDDVFSVLNNNFNTKLLTENNIFHNLTLNEVCNDEVNFLDLKISIDKVTNRIKFSVYLKPTNTFSYLLSSSNHPKFIFNNIPKGILIRYKRICSDNNNFLKIASETRSQLITRGYDPIKISKLINTLSLQPRSKFLDYKIKTNYIISNTLYVGELFDFNTKTKKGYLYNTFNSLKEKYNILNYFKTNMFNKIQPSLGAMLGNNIFSSVFNLQTFNYVKCDDKRCGICEYSMDVKFIHQNKFFLPISSSSSCTSNEFIYFIYCDICNAYYIGESKRLVKNRIYEHLNAIKKFVPYQKHHTSVATHFNLTNHSLKNFHFFILDNGLEHINRLHLEKKLIKLLSSYNYNLMNWDYPSHYTNIHCINVY